MNNISGGVTRRQFIRASATSFGALALRGYAVEGQAAVFFTHGVASGDPLADRVILWTRVLPGSGDDETVEVTWQVASDNKFDNVISQGVTATDQERDYTVKVDAGGLRAGQNYFYRFLCQGLSSVIGQTRTLPAAGVQSLNLAVVSCSNYPQGYFHVYRELSQRSVDVVVHLGDYIYEYPVGGYANPEIEAQGRVVKPSHEIIALEDYRTRYGLYRSDEDLQAAHRVHPFICIWDDHEITDNTWRAGALNHNPGEGDFFVRRDAAIQAFYEWLPIREPAQGNRERIYRQFDFGELASLIMLDTRLIGRDEQLSHDLEVNDLKRALANPERTIMGAEQERWLQQNLQSSQKKNIPWQIIGQQLLMGNVGIPQIPDSELDQKNSNFVSSGRYEKYRRQGRENIPLNLDAWDGYPKCRQRVLEAFKQNANNVVVLAGDSHSSWAFELSETVQSPPIAVEYATPSITSPGFENILPVPSERLEQAIMSVSPELKYFNAAGRGWLEIEVTAKRTVAQYLYVSSVVEKRYQVITGPRFVTNAGDHRVQS